MHFKPKGICEAFPNKVPTEILFGIGKHDKRERELGETKKKLLRDKEKLKDSFGKLLIYY